jgi:hypothetical protein
MSLFPSTFAALFVKKISQTSPFPSLRLPFLALSGPFRSRSADVRAGKGFCAKLCSSFSQALIVRSNETILPSQTKLRLLQHITGERESSRRAFCAPHCARGGRRLLRKANLLPFDLLPHRFARITDRCCYARSPSVIYDKRRARTCPPMLFPSQLVRENCQITEFGLGPNSYFTGNQEYTQCGVEN